LANELKQNGVTAESGQKFVPGGVKVDRQTLDNGIKESGADGVITVQMIIDEQIDMEPVTGDITSDNWYPSVFSSGDRYAHFYVSPDQPLNISSFEVGKIQVNLFDSQSGKLQWAATIKASKPGDVVSVAKDLAHIVVRSLKSEDLI
jgi:hypothetical protein